MHNQTPATTVRRLIDGVLNARAFERAGEFISPHFIDQGPAMQDQPAGVEGFRQVNAMLYTDFPDLELTIEDMFGEGDRVGVRFTARGTHSGPLADIPPTGERVEWEGISILRVEDGPGGRTLVTI